MEGSEMRACLAGLRNNKAGVASTEKLKRTEFGERCIFKSKYLLLVWFGFEKGHIFT